MLTYFLIGAAIGAGTGIPIGPVNVAVIDTAYRHTLRRAIAVGLGGSVGDCLYAMLGIMGVGPLLERHPEVPPYLYLFSGLVLLVYGVLTVRTKPTPPVTEPKHRSSDPSARMWPGFVLGFSLIILNPAAIVTWVIIVGSVLKGIEPMDGLGATLGVGVGSFLWFSLVAYLATHGKKVLGEKAVWITRIVGYLLILYGLYSVGRALYTWLF
ncbi:MAG: LysE family transporter [Myxococcota bacterium]